MSMKHILKKFWNDENRYHKLIDKRACSCKNNQLK